MEGEAGHGLCPGVHGEEKARRCDLMWLAGSAVGGIGLSCHSWADISSTWLTAVQRLHQPPRSMWWRQPAFESCRRNSSAGGHQIAAVSPLWLWVSVVSRDLQSLSRRGYDVAWITQTIGAQAGAVTWMVNLPGKCCLHRPHRKGDVGRFLRSCEIRLETTWPLDSFLL